MSKQRFSKATVREVLEERLTSALFGYRTATGIHYDHHNGTAQIPEHASNDAWLEYGKIVALYALLEDLGL